MWRIVKFIGMVLGAFLVIASCQHVQNSGNTNLGQKAPDALRIATYNVHYIILRKETGSWSVADWDRRKEPLDLAFKEVGADIMAFQEMESFAGRGQNGTNLTLDWLLENNAGYGAAAVGDPNAFPSTQPILYRKDRLQMADQGWFFFSETPDVIYSRTYDGSFPAFASWAEFRDLSSSAVFKVVSIHTDFSSKFNRRKSLQLVTDRIAPWISQGETVFVVGDFNARLGEAILDPLVELGVNFVPVQGSTYHFNRGINLSSAIDHIGVTEGATSLGEAMVLRKKFNGEWPTDHYPVAADFVINAQ